MIQAVGLLDQDFKQLVVNMLRKLDEKRQNFSRDMETVRKLSND